METIYNISVKDIKGNDVSLSEYKGKVLLIVNTASKCGFTPQYDGLQELYDKYKDNGFEILSFPCNQFMNQEPGSNEEIESFCSLNYGVKFRIFDKIDVKGNKQHPLYKYLTEESGGFISKEIKWNFTKFLISQEGKIIKRYAPTTTPEKIEPDILRLLDT